MGSLPHYAKIVEPSLDKPKDGKIYFMKSRDGYSALPIDYIDEIENALTKIINLTMDFRDDVKKRIESIADSAGTKFISIDGNDLKLVDKDAFNELAEDIYSAVLSCKNSFDTKLKQWPNTINEINEWLRTLEVNYENYKETERLSVKYKRAYDTANYQLENNILTYGETKEIIQNRLEKYGRLYGETMKKLKNDFPEVLDPFEYGSWVPVSYQGYVGPGGSYYI